MSSANSNFLSAAPLIAAASEYQRDPTIFASKEECALYKYHLFKERKFYLDLLRKNKCSPTVEQIKYDSQDYLVIKLSKDSHGYLMRISNENDGSGWPKGTALPHYVQLLPRPGHITGRRNCLYTYSKDGSIKAHTIDDYEEEESKLCRAFAAAKSNANNNPFNRFYNRFTLALSALVGGGFWESDMGRQVAKDIGIRSNPELRRTDTFVKVNSEIEFLKFLIKTDNDDISPSNTYRYCYINTFHIVVTENVKKHLNINTQFKEILDFLTGNNVTEKYCLLRKMARSVSHPILLGSNGEKIIPTFALYLLYSFNLIDLARSTIKQFKYFEEDDYRRLWRQHPYYAARLSSEVEEAKSQTVAAIAPTFFAPPAGSSSSTSALSATAPPVMSGSNQPMPPTVTVVATLAPLLTISAQPKHELTGASSSRSEAKEAKLQAVPTIPAQSAPSTSSSQSAFVPTPRSTDSQSTSKTSSSHATLATISPSTTPPRLFFKAHRRFHKKSTNASSTPDTSSTNPSLETLLANVSLCGFPGDLSASTSRSSKPTATSKEEPVVHVTFSVRLQNGKTIPVRIPTNDEESTKKIIEQQNRARTSYAQEKFPYNPSTSLSASRGASRSVHTLKHPSALIPNQ